MKTAKQGFAELAMAMFLAGAFGERKASKIERKWFAHSDETQDRIFVAFFGLGL